MQVILKNEDEKSSSRRANIVDTVICAERVSRYLEEKHLKRFRRRTVGI